jgi:hypothetical protein
MKKSSSLFMEKTMPKIKYASPFDEQKYGSYSVFSDSVSSYG